MPKNSLLFVPPLILIGVIFFIPTVVRHRLEIDTPSDHWVNINRPLTTLFTPVHSRLDIVILRLKNPGLANTSDYSFSLLDSSSKPLYSTIFSGRNVGDPSDLRLQFPPLDNSTQISSIRIEPASGNFTSHLQVLTDADENFSFRAYYRRSGYISGLFQTFFGFLATVTSDWQFLVLWAISLLIIGRQATRHG